MILPLVIAASLLVGAPADPDPDPPLWRASFFAEVARPSTGELWRSYTLSTGRMFSRGGLFGQITRRERFGLEDQAVALDAYPELWRGAYAHLHLQAAGDAALFPEYQAGAELFQALSAGWEASASYRYQSFPVADVHLLGAGVALYIGDWYLRGRTQAAQVEGEWAPFAALSARRYLGSVDDVLDVVAGGGREVLDLEPSPDHSTITVRATGTVFGAVRWQRYLTPRWGISLGTAYGAYGEVPDRWTASAGLLARW